MKKTVIIILILLNTVFIIFSKKITTVQNNEYQGKTLIVTFSPFEQKKTLIAQQSIFYDKNNVIIKVENIISDKHAQETKISRQTDYLNEKQQPVKYDIFFIEEYEVQRGIDKSTEYLNDKDQVVKTEYFNKDQLIYTDTIDDYEMFKDYPFLSLNFCNNYLSEGYNNFKKNTANKNSQFLLFDMWYLKGRTVVKSENETAELTKDDIDFIEMIWNRSFPQYKYANYSRKFQISENGNKYWIIIDDLYLEKLKTGKNFLIMYYFGGKNDMPYFMVFKVIEIN